MEIVQTIMSLGAASSLVWTLQEPVITKLKGNCKQYFLLRGLLSLTAASCVAAVLVPSIPAIALTTLVGATSL